MKVGKFLAAVILAVFFMTGNCFAGNYPDEYLAVLKDKHPDLYARVLEGIDAEPFDLFAPSLLNDMKINAENYIESGTTYSFANASVMQKHYIFKPSLKVQQDQPPQYIISIKLVLYHPEVSYATAALWHYTYKFLYDSSEEKIYMRNIDSNNQPYWQYLDPKFANARNESQAYDLEAAELTFYFAYKKSFFKKPLSKSLKNYIKTGKLKTFADML